METALNFELPEFLARANARTLILPNAEDRMRFVLDLARQNVAADGGPFAAAVFEHESGRLLAAGANRVVASGYSCAHAEVVALSLAQSRLGHYDLGQADFPACELVSSAEPCLMCLGAVLWSGITRLTYGAAAADVSSMTVTKIAILPQGLFIAPPFAQAFIIDLFTSQQQYSGQIVSRGRPGRECKET